MKKLFKTLAISLIIWIVAMAVASVAHRPLWNPNHLHYNLELSFDDSHPDNINTAGYHNIYIGKDIKAVNGENYTLHIDNSSTTLTPSEFWQMRSAIKLLEYKEWN